MPNSVADTTLQYLRLRAEELTKLSKSLAEDHALDECLGARSLAMAIRSVEALIMTDQARTQSLRESQPDLKIANGVATVVADAI